MPRKNLFEEKRKEPAVDSSELSKIVSSYINNKSLESEYKDLASVENTRIKAIMEQLKITECKDLEGANIAKLTYQKKESFIEEKLIQFLKDNKCAKNIVKKKEYVDMDALESAIYHGDISETLVKEMASCKEVKTIPTLRISKVKGDK